jgi:hypothetical protein
VVTAEVGKTHTASRSMLASANQMMSDSAELKTYVDRFLTEVRAV